MRQGPLARVGAIGDVHAEDERLEAALVHLRAEHVDLMVAVGDIVDGRGDVDKCCALLQTACAAVVSGNRDRWFLEGASRDMSEATQGQQVAASSRVFLSGLPRVREFETVAGPLLLCHGLGTNDMGHVGPDDFGYAIDANADLQKLIRAGTVRFVINGHTHRRMVRRFGELTIINAGTLYRDHEPCVAIIDFVRARVQYFDFGPGTAVLRGPSFGFNGGRLI